MDDSIYYKNLFCKVYSKVNGDQIDKIEQLKLDTLTGEELYKLCIAFHVAAFISTYKEVACKPKSKLDFFDWLIGLDDSTIP